MDRLQLRLHTFQQAAFAFFPPLQLHPAVNVHFGNFYFCCSNLLPLQLSLLLFQFLQKKELSMRLFFYLYKATEHTFLHQLLSDKLQHNTHAICLEFFLFLPYLLQFLLFSLLLSYQNRQLLCMLFLKSLPHFFKGQHFSF